MDQHTINSILYMIPIIASFIITFGLSLLAYSRRRVTGGLLFAIVLLLESEWLVGYIIGLLSPNLEQKIFWENIQYFGTLLGPLMILVFAVEYVDQNSVGKAKLWVGLSLPAIVIIILSFTNPYHHLALLNQRLIPSEPFGIYAYNFGVPVYAVLFYCYGLMIWSIYLLIKHYIQQNGIYRRQTGFILAGITIPVICSITIFFDLKFLPQRDISPFYFALANLFTAYGLFRVGIFEIVPIGRNLVVSNMRDGVLLVDVSYHLVDINQSARDLIGDPNLNPKGQLVSSIPGKWGGYLRFEGNIDTPCSKEVSFSEQWKQQYYDITVTRIINNKGQFVGYMIILRDITERKQLELERSQSHGLLEQRVSERTADLVMANEKLNAEVEQRRRAELEKEKQRHEMEILYSMTFELAAMPLDADLESIVTKRLKELTGAFIATVSEYNPAKKQLELRCIETESNAIREANRLMKRRISELNFPVSDTVYKEMVKTVVGHRNSLNEATFGSIPPTVSTILQRVFNLQSFIGMAIQHEGELMGTLMIVLQQGQTLPSDWLVISLANVLSIVYRRKRAENERLESENRFRTLAEMLPQAIYECDLSGQLTYVNRKAFEMFGFTQIEPGQNVFTMVVQSDRERVQDKVKHMIEGLGDTNSEYMALHKNGSTFPVLIYSTTVIKDNHPVGFRGVVVDISELKLAEEKIQQSDKKYRELFHINNDGIAIYFKGADQGSKTLVEMNEAVHNMLGYTREELFRFFPAIFEFELTKAEFHLHQDELESQGITNFETVLVHKDGHFVNVEFTVQLIQYEGQSAVMNIIRDVTERKQHEYELQAIATLSAALRAAPSRSEMLPVIVDQIASLINCDLVDIEIIEPISGDTIVEAAFGVWKPLVGTRQMKGTGLNAVISETLRPYHTNYLEKEEDLPFPNWAYEGIRAYAGVPLVAQENLIGFIWIGQKIDISVTEIQLLSAITDIAANAIHRATMHEQVLQYAINLSSAYDTTLEGWVNALELRDRETEGHARRVVEVTINLAQKMGIGAVDEINIRRGALLHDIGKMGIPDSVLLKPGPLNEREWEMMRMHPEYAHRLLTPIEYLNPAIEIPYCHHEKWDGTGYPRGLKGEEIPLAARIFAIVDVWEALTSDRPYRPAWSNGKALEYINNQRGKHFDPTVVDNFMDLLKGPLSSLNKY
jgi:PAS domain S-box-containing protein